MCGKIPDDIGYDIVGFSFDIQGYSINIVFRHEDALKTPFLPFFDIEGQNYDIVHDIVTWYEDAPNPRFLPPDIKPDIVEKEPISNEIVPAIFVYTDVV